MDNIKKNNEVEGMAMQKNTDKDSVVEKGSSTFSIHIRNHIYLYVSFFLIVCLLLCVIAFYPKEQVLLIEKNSNEDLISEFSEKFGVNKDYMNMLDSSNLWYDEYIYANVREGFIVHHHDNTEDTIGYDNVPRKETIKKLKNKNESTLNALNAIVEKFSDIRQRVIKEYSDELDNISDTSDKRLSYIYNGIVGDPIGHYLIAYKNDGIKYITRDDFPQYTINRKRLVEVLNRKDLDTSKNLYDFLVDEGVLHKEDLVFGYVDFRKNKLFINDTVYIRGTLGGDLYGKYYDTICQRPGMVLYNNEIRSWLDLLHNNEAVWCNPDVDNLKSLKVKAIEEPYPIWLLFLGILCGVIIGLFLYFIRGFVKTKKDGIKIEKEPTPESQDITIDNKETKFYEKLKTLLNRRWELNDLFDLLINEFAKKEIKDTKEYVHNNEVDAVKYRNFKNVSSEKELLRLLDSMHKDDNNFPEITTSLKALYKKAKEKSEKEKLEKEYLIIDNILREVEVKADSKDNLCGYFSDKYKESNYYKAIQGKLRYNLRNGDNAFSIIKGGLDRLERNSQVMSDFVDFAKLFVGDFSKGELYSKSFEETKKIIDWSSRDISSISQKETLNYWERLTLILWSVTKVAVPLMNAWKKDLKCAGKVRDIETSIKSDMLQLYQSRIFMKYQDVKYSIDDFNKFVNNDYRKALDDFNKNNQGFILNSDDGVEKLYKKTMEKLKYGDKFIDNMWTAFVEDFVNNVENNKDKSWYFEHVINIAIHAAEYVDAIKRDRIDYCYNLKMLMSGFDDLKIGDVVKEYKHENPLFSSPYADRVYDWADELNIKHLKILVNKYYIMQ